MRNETREGGGEGKVGGNARVKKGARERKGTRGAKRERGRKREKRIAQNMCVREPKKRSESCKMMCSGGSVFLSIDVGRALAVRMNSWGGAFFFT